MKSEIARAIRLYGEPVEFTPQGGAMMPLTMSVQSPLIDPLVGDEDMESYLVYADPATLPSLPKKFDRIRFRGKNRALDEDATVEYFEGVAIAYVMRVRG